MNNNDRMNEVKTAIKHNHSQDNHSNPIWSMPSAKGHSKKIITNEIPFSFNEIPLKDEQKNISHDSPNSMIEQLGEGQALAFTEKNKMESFFSADFGEVVIHNNQKAAELSTQLNAKAFTVGNHIAFGAGKYRPGTLIGDALLAHEMAHVFQQRGAVSTSNNSHSLEKDANQSLWQNASNFLLGNKKAVGGFLPKLKTGLSIQRCDNSSSGAIGEARVREATSNFRSNNSQLSTLELDKIVDSMNVVTTGNLNLEIAFYDYYSNHDIIKDDAITGSHYATTLPNSDTRINPDIVEPSFSNARLGGLLLHEYVHTRHNTNVMGMGDYQEGGAYAVELFFAEKNSDTERISAIISLVTTRGTLTIASLHAGLLDDFRSTYSTLKALYEIIDTGSSPQSTGPLTTLSVDAARILSTELINTNTDSRSTELNELITWIRSNIMTSYSPI
ncbi:uncharacterized protein DUF4157 [Mariniflexile fucanivorans]|uniref:Uncharacterized protein DUF4157 n=2 Tax=Mariniflexile fucanivorans TaxID=264023 RepID=A0A4R1RAW1_9FLAO|nr:uncharacterized protein DUF4157 [Mariniflexile fucanivorans]